MQSAFKFAMLNHNLNLTARRFELQAYVDVINTADAFKLSRLSKYNFKIYLHPIFPIVSINCSRMTIKCYQLKLPKTNSFLTQIFSANSHQNLSFGFYNASRCALFAIYLSRLSEPRILTSDFKNFIHPVPERFVRSFTLS